MALLVAVVVSLAIVAAVRLLLAYMRRRRLELAIPGPPSLPLLGNTLEFLDATKHNVMQKMLTLWGSRYTELSRMSIAGHLMVFVSDPGHLQELFTRKDLADKDPLTTNFIKDMLRYGLLALNGELWRVHRRALQPAFHQSVLDRYMPVFSAEALRFVRHVRLGEEQGVEDKVEILTLRSFIWTAGSVEELSGDEVERLLPDMQFLLNVAAESVPYRLFRPWLWPRWAFDLTALGRNLKRHKEKLGGFMRHSVISVRRKELQLQSERPNDGEANPKTWRRTLLDAMLAPDSPLSDEEITDELLIFGAGASETTIATLGWVFKTLSLRHDVQELLLREVEEILGTDGAAQITTQDIDKLEYMDRVIKETLRLLPAGPFLARGVKEQTDFCGHTLPAGTTLFINALGAHRHPGHWPDPLRFDPDRFLPERSQGRHPYAYLPFSAGPRNCIAGRYAMMLMKTLLATLVPRFCIDPVDDGFTEPAELPMTFGLASRMVGGVRVVFTPRVQLDSHRDAGD